MSDSDTPDIINYIINYMKSNLSINVKEETCFGPTEKVTIQLLLNGEVIAEDFFDKGE